MKTYIVTEKDISDIKSLAILNDDIAIDDILENLNELPPPKKLELNENRTEFSKFIEDSGFIKPEQPYYIKDGEVFEYGDLRQLFLESREKNKTDDLQQP